MSHNLLKAHIKYAHDTEKQKCYICSEMIIKCYLKTHIVNNHGEKLTCDVCDKTFATEEAFKKHKFIHEVSKYSCNVCKRAYSNKSRLTTHKKTVHQFELEFF